MLLYAEGAERVDDSSLVIASPKILKYRETGGDWAFIWGDG